MHLSFLPNPSTVMHKLRIVSFNCQSFKTNKDLSYKLMERCDFLLLQEALIIDYNSNKLYLIAEGNIGMSYIPVKLFTNLTGGRPSDGLAIFWKSVNSLTWKTIQNIGCIMGLTLEAIYFIHVILNIYMNCFRRTLESLYEYQSCISCFSNFISEETFGQIMIIRDMNCDPDTERFFFMSLRA